MAEVRPLTALHYDLGAVGSLADVTAPPYDVIDEAMRKRLRERSPFNVVEIDLPRSPNGTDPYQYAAQTLESWTLEGIVRADREPMIWALTQDYERPDGRRRTRRGFLARIRLAPYGEGIRAHERTQPRPKEDRLRLTRATRHNLSPIFVLHSGDGWRHLEPATGSAPWATVADDEGTTHRVWRVGDPAVHDAIAAELADAELLIADGHHRYETALAYAGEVGGEGPHRYVLACLVSLEDPGLTVFPTHRLVSGLDPAKQEAIRDVATELFEIEEVGADELVPSADAPPATFGYMDAYRLAPRRLRLRNPISLDEALAGHSDAYRRLDSAALEALFLRRALGMSEDDIAAQSGIGYTQSADEAVAKLRAGEYDAAFFLRPPPVDEVRAVAASGETMPPKSTYFFPKLLTGIVFNPLG